MKKSSKGSLSYGKWSWIIFGTVLAIFAVIYLIALSTSSKISAYVFLGAFAIIFVLSLINVYFSYKAMKLKSTYSILLLISIVTAVFVFKGFGIIATP